MSCRASPAGSGSLLHVVAELLQRRTGTEMTSVHFRGSAAAIPEVLAGRVPVIVDPLTIIAPHICEGRLRGLMVAAYSNFRSYRLTKIAL